MGADPPDSPLPQIQREWPEILLKLLCNPKKSVFSVCRPQGEFLTRFFGWIVSIIYFARDLEVGPNLYLQPTPRKILPKVKNQAKSMVLVGLRKINLPRAQMVF